MKNSENKEMRKLSRAELLDIIYEMKKNEVKLQKELDEVKEELKNRDIKIQQAGSIAEAALTLNDVFKAAQNAADDYVQNVKARCRQMLEEAEERTKKINTGENND